MSQYPEVHWHDQRVFSSRFSRSPPQDRRDLQTQPNSHLVPPSILRRREEETGNYIYEVASAFDTNGQIELEDGEIEIHQDEADERRTKARCESARRRLTTILAQTPWWFFQTRWRCIETMGYDPRTLELVIKRLAEVQGRLGGLLPPTDTPVVELLDQLVKTGWVQEAIRDWEMHHPYCRKTRRHDIYVPCEECLRALQFHQQLQEEYRRKPRNTPFIQHVNCYAKASCAASSNEEMHTFLDMSWAILQDDGPIRESVIEMVTALDRIQSEDARGSRLASMLDPTSPTNILPMRSDQHCVLSEDEYGLLFNLLTTHPQDMAQDNHLPRQCRSLSKLSINSICYGVAGTSSYRDSTAIFRPRQAGADPNPRELAGTIQRIFQYSYSMAGQDKQGYFVSIMEHQRITESRGAEADPYPAFGHAAGYLCERAPERLHVLELSQLVSHFVLTYFPEGEWVNYIHVLPVDRLMLSFRFEDNSTDDTDLPHEAT
ncbi:hypothetical protein BDN72DRAFT_963854 [Pluteus cervinus]|uniref:Uncharacterized protein n=1 Tax=Pluteus cervinus TaxID=181527 RepID=A0ACD3ACY1_9AGAR|nr:hypothetical protein BDN72DRAFT_963854 [Pluteus cervinus]